jgi:hypothetical protein
MNITLTRLARNLERSTGVLPQVEWVEKMRSVTYPTGLKGRTGAIRVTADGYRTKVMRVSADHDSLMIR